MEILKAAAIYNAVNDVKDGPETPFVKVAGKEYVSIEDVRSIIFDLGQKLKSGARAGEHLCGWQTADVNFMNQIINESLNDIYEKIGEKP